MEWLYVSNSPQTAAFSKTIKNMLEETAGTLTELNILDLSVEKIKETVDRIYSINYLNDNILVITIDYHFYQLFEYRNFEGILYHYYNDCKEVEFELLELMNYLIRKFKENRKIWVQVIGLDSLCMVTYLTHNIAKHNMMYNTNIIVPQELIDDLYQSSVKLETLCITINKKIRNMLKINKLENISYMTLSQYIWNTSKRDMSAWFNGDVKFKPIRTFWEVDSKLKSQRSIEYICNKIKSIVRYKFLPHRDLFAKIALQDRSGSESNDNTNISFTSLNTIDTNISGHMSDTHRHSTPERENISIDNFSMNSSPIQNVFYPYGTGVPVDNREIVNPTYAMPIMPDFSKPPPNYNFPTNLVFKESLRNVRINEININNNNGQTHEQLNLPSCSTKEIETIYVTPSRKQTSVRPKTTFVNDPLSNVTKSPPKKLFKISPKSKNIKTQVVNTENEEQPINLIKIFDNTRKAKLDTKFKIPKIQLTRIVMPKWTQLKFIGDSTIGNVYRAFDCPQYYKKSLNDRPGRKFDDIKKVLWEEIINDHAEKSYNFRYIVMAGVCDWLIRTPFVVDLNLDYDFNRDILGGLIESEELLKTTYFEQGKIIWIIPMVPDLKRANTKKYKYDNYNLMLAEDKNYFIKGIKMNQFNIGMDQELVRRGYTFVNFQKIQEDMELFSRDMKEYFDEKQDNVVFPSYILTRDGYHINMLGARRLVEILLRHI